jgi:hypothetical protein
MALSSMGTVFFTAFATLTGTARSGAFAAVCELHENPARDAASSATRAAIDFVLFSGNDLFMVSFVEQALRLLLLSSIPHRV